MQKTRQKKQKYLISSLLILGLSVFGAINLLAVHASTSLISQEIENGSFMAPALVKSDTTASGGKSVLFTSSTQKPLQLSQPFYNDGGNQAGTAYNTATDPVKKHLYWQLVATPTTEWLGVDNDQAHFTNSVNRIITAAKNQKATPIFTLYAVPGRDCGSYSAGGFADLESYERWIDWFSAALGTNPALVIVEPDAIGICQNFTAQQKADRLAMLTYDMTTITARNPNAYTYLHAGSGELMTSDAVNVLLKSGVGKGRGIAMNVASFGSTQEETTAANAIISGLAKAGAPNMHYIVDTSRNGMGRYTEGTNPWCNPPGRAPGVRPTTKTDDPLADAYIWVKQSGGSDGTCHPGDLPSGKFMPAMAEAEVQLALDKRIIEDLPNGTYYNGF